MTQYWVVPEDISTAWSKLRPFLEATAKHHPNESMTVSITTNGGIFTEMADPVFRRLEPRATAPDGKEWWSFIRRLISVAERDGRYLLVSEVRLDGVGQPVSWTTPTVQKLEPRRG